MDHHARRVFLNFWEVPDGRPEYQKERPEYQKERGGALRSVLIDPMCGEPEVTCIREAQSTNELPGPTGSGRKSGQMSPGCRSSRYPVIGQNQIS